MRSILNLRQTSLHMSVTTSDISTMQQAASFDRSGSSMLAFKACTSNVTRPPIVSASFASPLGDDDLRWDDPDSRMACEEVVNDDLSDAGSSE